MLANVVSYGGDLITINTCRNLISVLTPDLRHTDGGNSILLHMINTNYATGEFYSIEIVCSENGALLVFITDKSKSLRTSSICVSHEVYVSDFTVL